MPIPYRAVSGSAPNVSRKVNRKRLVSREYSQMDARRPPWACLQYLAERRFTVGKSCRASACAHVFGVAAVIGHGLLRVYNACEMRLIASFR
ncbi:hypothetical protein PsYK624_003710 [Phanerochaete sordida]|uniref:Uncharacterized protein n=1 Tax=Phanerochaete sordida TaxID=48140 RepID=A0A9P3L6W7_9APHY|nr:hypothetical protein PsYK624_003710 [Phanerochaete sordida]